MKIAVLLFGQPRDAINCSKSIVNNIINPNNADVFFHMWYDENDLYMEKGEKDRSECNLNKGLDQKLVEIYNPKAYCIEPQKFKHFNNYNNGYFKCPEVYVNNMSKCGKNKELTKEEVELKPDRSTQLAGSVRQTHLVRIAMVLKRVTRRPSAGEQKRSIGDVKEDIHYDRPWHKQDQEKCKYTDKYTHSDQCVSLVSCVRDRLTFGPGGGEEVEFVCSHVVFMIRTLSTRRSAHEWNRTRNTMEMSAVVAGIVYENVLESVKLLSNILVRSLGSVH